MSFNLVKFDAAKFSVDAYTEAVEAEFAAEFSIDNYTAAVEAEFLQAFFDNDEDADKSIDDDDDVGRKKRSPNAFEYRFGDVYEASWYRRFLCDAVREKTYYLSQRDRYGEFRSLFCMPLTKIDDIVSLFIEKGWVYQTKHCKCEKEMTIKWSCECWVLLKLLVITLHLELCKATRIFLTRKTAPSSKHSLIVCFLSRKIVFVTQQHKKIWMK